MEDPIAMTECAINKDNCILSNECYLKENWASINNFLINTLASINLADMSRTISKQSVKFKISQPS